MIALLLFSVHLSAPLGLIILYVAGLLLSLFAVFQRWATRRRVAVKLLDDATAFAQYLRLQNKAVDHDVIDIGLPWRRRLILVQGAAKDWHIAIAKAAFGSRALIDCRLAGPFAASIAAIVFVARNEPIIGIPIMAGMMVLEFALLEILAARRRTAIQHPQFSGKWETLGVDNAVAKRLSGCFDEKSASKSQQLSPKEMLTSGSAERVVGNYSVG